MSVYSLYWMSVAGEIPRPPLEYNADDDAQAFRAACRALDAQPLELWQESRLVAKLTPRADTPNPESIIVIKQ